MQPNMTKVISPDGSVRWRDKNARNQYNPEGITLESLRKTLAPDYYDQLRKIREYEERGSHRWLGTVDTESPYSEAAFMIRDGDKDIANFIAEYPITTIAATEVSRTITRWMYSARYSRINDIKNHGQEMLDIAFPPLGHRPTEVPYTHSSMLASYQDAMALAKGINSCIKRCKEEGGTIEQYFLFANDLKPLGYDLIYLMKQPKSDLTPSEFANSLLQHFSGLKRTTISKVISEAKDVPSDD